MKFFNNKNASLKLVYAMFLTVFANGVYGSVVQDVSNGSGTINSGYGQSFLATEDYASIGFYLEEWYGPGTRTAFPAGADFTIEFNLYEGEGFSGPLLKSFEAPDPGAGFSDFYNFDLSDVDFNNGTSYTAEIYSPYGLWGTDTLGYYRDYAGEDFYTGGTLYDGSGVAVNGDMRFRLNPVAVPEPASLALLVAGLLGIAAKARRRV